MRTLKTWLYLSLAMLLYQPALATTYEPYVVRNSERTAENTVRMLEGSPHFWLFQQELQKNTGFQFGDLAEAVERGMLVTKPCGTCRLETPGIKNGESVYHRRVRPEEPVAYLNDVPVFLPACGNPVRALEPIPVPQLVPQPAPPPQPQVVIPPPRIERPEGCTEDFVTYTTGYWEHPSIYGIPYDYVRGAGGGGFSWTTSHHDWACVQQPITAEEELR